MHRLGHAVGLPLRDDVHSLDAPVAELWSGLPHTLLVAFLFLAVVESSEISSSFATDFGWTWPMRVRWSIGLGAVSGFAGILPVALVDAFAGGGAAVAFAALGLADGDGFFAIVLRAESWSCGGTSTGSLATRRDVRAAVGARRHARSRSMGLGVGWVEALGAVTVVRPTHDVCQLHGQLGSRT